MLVSGVWRTRTYLFAQALGLLQPLTFLVIPSYWQFKGCALSLVQMFIL